MKLKYLAGKLKINLITTTKETKNKVNKTQQLVNQLLPKYNASLGYDLFNHVHYPYSSGRKAHQLNYALKSGVTSTKKTYVGTYDADSRPHLNTLIDLATHATLDNYGPAYQQLSLYLKNYDKVNLLGKAIALFQTRWSFAYEYDTYVRYQRVKSDSGNRLSYVVGHGNFIRYDVLQKVGGFPEETPIEDLALGYKLSSMKIPIRPLCYFDNCEVPDSTIKFIKQGSTWYAGDVQGLRSLCILRHLRCSDFSLIVAYLKRKYCDLRWSFGSLIVIALLFLAMWVKDYDLALLLSFSSLLYCISGMRTIFRNANLFKRISSHVPDMKGTYLLYVFLVVRGILNSVGIHYYLTLLLGGDRDYYKTER